MEQSQPSFEERSIRACQRPLLNLHAQPPLVLASHFIPGEHIFQDVDTAGILQQLIGAPIPGVPAVVHQDLWDHCDGRLIRAQQMELEILGITHCESGKFLAEKWHLGEELTTVIAFHHDIDRAPEHRMLTAIVALADLLCRMNAMGYGFPEDRQVDLTTEPAFACLMSESPTSKSVDWARITMEMDGYLEEVRRLVALLFRSK